jgi:nitrous oxidase accessory protein
VQHSRGVSGAGLAFKESGQCIVEDNDVIHCAVGAKTNAPTSPDAIITFSGNRFAHNIAGMDFYGENGGHVIHGNRFEHNLTQVTVSAAMSARGNDWRDNLWDDYEGFDRDGDGVGDTPYDVYSFADRIWQETPQASFFRNAPALELLDFLERLAPFANPELTLSDPSPRMVAAPRAVRSTDFTPSCPP